MSEPLSTPEIEDVVSSVRRLVSTTLSPRVKTRDLAHDKLILTPSLRVVPDAAPVPLAEVPAAVSVLTEPEAPFIEVEAADSPSGVALHLVEAEWEDELWAAPEAPLAEIAAGLEDAEVVVATKTEPSASVWPNEGTVPTPWVETEAEWVEEAPIPFIPLHRAAAGAAEKVPSEAQTPEVEGAVTAEPASVASGAEQSEVSEKAAEAERPPVLFDEDGSPIAILDEEELNEVVRSLIREELQGALGERITRNVRKLVRAEINRALAARAFD
jgi:hypothetical protein